MMKAKNYKLTFGLHKGKSLQYIHRNFPKYFDWLQSDSFEDIKSIKPIIEEYLKDAEDVSGKLDDEFEKMFLYIEELDLEIIKAIDEKNKELEKFIDKLCSAEFNYRLYKIAYDFNLSYEVVSKKLYLFTDARNEKETK
jgi:hypothetical protein